MTSAIKIKYGDEILFDYIRDGWVEEDIQMTVEGLFWGNIDGRNTWIISGRGLGSYFAMDRMMWIRIVQDETGK